MAVRPFKSLLLTLRIRRPGYSGPGILVSGSKTFVRGLRLTTAYKRLPEDAKVEEERLSYYGADLYYPVYIGEILHSRYRVVCKLGWGSRSTAWLCRDLRDGGYSAIKVCVRQSVWLENEMDPLNEIKILQHLKESLVEVEEGKTVPVDLETMRFASGSFEITGPSGEKHQCLIHDPRGSSAHSCRRHVFDGSYPYDYMQLTILKLSLALLWLHGSGVVHTDISPSNILEGIGDASMFLEIDKDEYAKPAPCKILEGRTVYCSRLLPFKPGQQVLCDFGEALVGSTFTHRAMPDTYRAPEVVMEMEWSAQVDVWSLAMTAVGMIEGDEMFSPRDENGGYNVILHLRQMHDLMGPPPSEFLRRSKYCEIYWDEDGEWKHTQITEPVFEGLESRVTRLNGDEKEKFIAFLRRIMKWLPEERPTAEQLLGDEWFLQAYGSPDAEDGIDEKTVT